MTGAASVRNARTVVNGWCDRRAARAVADALYPEIGRLKAPPLALADVLGCGDATAEKYWYAMRAMKLREFMAVCDAWPAVPGRLYVLEDARAARVRDLLDRAIREIGP